MMKNIVLLTSLALFFLSCSQSEENQPATYSLSTDICQVCKAPWYFVFGSDTLIVSSIVTANGDGLNDKLRVAWHDSAWATYPCRMTIRDRNGTQIMHYENYTGTWPEDLYSSPGQNTAGLVNGLYGFTLASGAASTSGFFILLLGRDAYIDKSFLELPCHNCVIFDEADPMLAKK